MRDGNGDRAFERGVVKNMDGKNDRGCATHEILNRRERSALAAELALRGRGVRIRLEMAAGVHHHAELGEQQRQRQHMHEPTAIASNQKGLREEVFPELMLSARSDSRKLHARWSPY